MKRNIVVGDVHGCVDEVKDLVEVLNYNPDKDRLVFVGDLVDRGPDSPGVIALLRKLKAECVLGNHDEKLIRYHRHMLKKKDDPDYVIPMRPPYGERADQYTKLTDEDWAYLEAMPPFIRIGGNWVAVHAGVEPGIPLEEQKESVLTHMRYVKKDTMKMEKKLEELTSENSIFWTNVWDGAENVIYGHHVSPGPHISISEKGRLCVGIDTGCCFGRSLTAMVLTEDGKEFSFISVPARKQYDDYSRYSAALKVS